VTKEMQTRAVARSRWTDGMDESSIVDGGMVNHEVGWSGGAGP